MDVKSAFLIGELQEDVFVEQEDLSITSPPLPVVLVIHAQGYLQIDRHVFFFACFVFSLTCASTSLWFAALLGGRGAGLARPRVLRRLSIQIGRHQTRRTKKETQHHGCCSILRSSFLSTKGSKYLLRSRCMLYKVINTYIHSRNPNFQISCYNYNKLIRQGKWVTQRHIGLDQPKLWNYYDLIPQ